VIFNMQSPAPQNTITAPPAALPKLSGGRLITIPLAAGATQTLTCQGTQFYFVVATGSCSARPRGRDMGAGDFVLYPQEGTGLDVGATFDFIDLENPNGFAIALAVWVGYGGFIDKRLILNNLANPNIVFPTYPTPNAGTVVNINDLSGQAFTDINGNAWIAISRVAILIFNLSAGNTYTLQAAGAGTGTGPAVASIPPPPLPLQLQFAGNYCINIGGAPVDMIVSEIYSAIPNTGL
jgi:hypothetical protein